VIADDRVRPVPELSPARVVILLEIRQRPALILVIAEGQDRIRVGILDQLGGRRLPAHDGIGGVLATGDIPGGDQGHGLGGLRGRHLLGRSSGYSSNHHHQEQQDPPLVR
jgi:hypothetical protein